MEADWGVDVVVDVEADERVGHTMAAAEVRTLLLLAIVYDLCASVS